MFYGYARCSTNEGEQDINRQVRELKQQGATGKTIYLKCESGMKTNRAELAKLLDIVKPGDTILTTEVSRITRSTKQLCDIIELAKDRKIKLVLGSLVVDSLPTTLLQSKYAKSPIIAAFISVKTRAFSYRAYRCLRHKAQDHHPLEPEENRHSGWRSGSSTGPMENG